MAVGVNTESIAGIQHNRQQHLHVIWKSVGKVRLRSRVRRENMRVQIMDKETDIERESCVTAALKNLFMA